MKKGIIILLCCVIIFVISLFAFNKENKANKIKVAEVAHTVFYAPQYVAQALGYFEDEGLNVEFILTPGADKVTAAVLSGDVQIGFSGSEATIYVYNANEKDYLQTFCGLTKRDGSFIVSRKQIENFSLKDMIGSDVVGGRKGYLI